MKLYKKTILVLLSGFLITGCTGKDVTSKTKDNINEEEIVTEVTNSDSIYYRLDGQLYQVDLAGAKPKAVEYDFKQREEVMDIDTGDEWVYETVQDNEKTSLYFSKAGDNKPTLIDEAPNLTISKHTDIVTNQEYIMYVKADSYWIPGHFGAENVSAYILKPGELDGLKLGLDDEETSWARAAVDLVIIDSVAYYTTDAHANEVATELLDSYDVVNARESHLPMNTLRYIELGEKDGQSRLHEQIFDPWEAELENLIEMDTLYSLPYCGILSADQEYIYVSTGYISADRGSFASIYSIDVNTKEVKEVHDGFEGPAYSSGATMKVKDDILYLSSSGRILETIFARIPLKNQCDSFEKYDSSLIHFKDNWVYYIEDFKSIRRIEFDSNNEEIIYTSQDDSEIYTAYVLGDWIIFSGAGTYYRVNIDTKELVEIESASPLAQIRVIKEGTGKEAYLIAKSLEDSKEELYIIDVETLEATLIDSGDRIEFWGEDYNNLQY